jgi:hypothetical protein
MSINCQFGDMDAHGAIIRAQAMAPDAEHQVITHDVLAAGDFWGCAGSAACQEFVTRLGSQLPSDLPASQLRPLQGANRGRQQADTELAIGSSWA